MSEVYLWSTQAAAVDWAGELGHLAATARLRYLMVERWNGPPLFVSFPNELRARAPLLGDGIAGGAFGAHVDVQWRLVGQDRIWAVAVSNQELAPLLPASHRAITWRYETDEMARCVGSRIQTRYLWGSQWLEDEQAWLEQRIPRLIDYPEKPQKGSFDAMLLGLQEYLDDSGEVIAIRRNQLTATYTPEAAATEMEDTHATA
jgi:hypothetical protein